MKNPVFYIVTLLIMIFSAGGCMPRTPNGIHPKWSRNAVMYEVNTRQITMEGTFAAFQRKLPGLKKMGIDIIWFMPIYPIGEEGRKGTLGSYYAIKDYTAVNPEFGTLQDFKNCVREAHRLGMKVIIDWVAAHTSRDAVWLDHYDWYIRRTDGQPEFLYDWSDVARLNYENPEMRQAMLRAMMFWVKEADVDGFRCDMADLTPVDFWEWAVPRLRQIKPDLFMLAESENPVNTKNAFNAFYAWTVHHTLNDMAAGRKNTDSLRTCLQTMNKLFGSRAIPLLFTSNHDENSWNGTEFERLGPAVRQMAVLTFALPGLPLIYTGQELGNKKRLEFFEKDFVGDSDPEGFSSFYSKLICLKANTPALEVPPYGGTVVDMANTNPQNVFSFTRSVEGSRILALFNFSGLPVSFQIIDPTVEGTYRNAFSGEVTVILTNTVWEMVPYEFLIFTAK